MPRERPQGAAAPCQDHENCIRFYRPDGAINEQGWWHAVWRDNAWHLRGPDPADAGFPGLGGPIERLVDPEPDENPLLVLSAFVGEDAVMDAVNVRLPSTQASFAGDAQARSLGLR